jgi:hypothetical protein
MAGEIGMGAFGGAVSGASAGAALGPWGMAAGGLIGGIAGIGQGKRAKQLEKDYQNAEKNADPFSIRMEAFLNRQRQQERLFRTGSDSSSAFAAGNARNVGAQTMANISRAGGPGVVGNLLRAQAGTNQAIAGIGASAAQGANQMMAAQQGLTQRMEDLAYQRRVELRNQALERSVSARQNIQNTFQGALAMVPGMVGNFKGLGGQKAAPQSFDPFAQRSAMPVGPQPFDVQLPMQQMQPRVPSASMGAPLPYQPFGGTNAPLPTAY